MPDLPDEGHELDVVVHERVKGKGLLRVPRLYAVGALLLDDLEQAAVFLVCGEGALGAVSNNEILVRIGGFAVEKPAGLDRARAVQVVDRIRGHVLDDVLAGVELADVLDLAGLVVLRLHADALRLHAEVDVLGHQDDPVRPVLAREVMRQGEYPVIGVVLPEYSPQLLAHLHVGVHDEESAGPEPHALAQEVVADERIELAGEFARVVVDDLVAALELVDFFEQGYGDDDVMLFEGVDAPVIIENDVGVENENFIGITL